MSPNIPKSDPLQRATAWLEQHGVVPDSLTSLSGYTNHVFLLAQSSSTYPQLSVLRLADFSLSASLCPLAGDFDAVLKKHAAVAELGLSPGVIAADKAERLMWLEYAGQPKTLELGDFPELQDMLVDLYRSALNWETREQQVSLEFLLHDLLTQLKSKGLTSRVIFNHLQDLLQQGQQCGYFDRPLVPIHGDLNSGNLLHNGQRWWLIDWDYSGMGLREWDYAGLIVEHDWDVGMAQQFIPQMALTELKWFCSCFALVSWHWHLQRESHQGVLDSKWRTMQYWITLRG